MQHKQRNLLCLALPLSGALFGCGSFMAPRVWAQVESAPSPITSNAVVNGDFEIGLTSWEARISGGAQASVTVISSERHSGKNSARLFNESAFAPNVYAGLIQNVSGLKPNTKYQVSAWAKGRDVGTAWIGGNADWSLRQNFPPGTYNWRRVSANFETGPSQTTWNVVIVVESPTTELLLDDIEVAELAQAQRPRLYLPTVLSGAGIGKGATLALDAGDYSAGAYDAKEQISGAFRETSNAARPAQTMTLALRKTDGSRETLGRVALPAASAKATREVKFSVPAAAYPQGSYQLSASLDGEPPIATIKFSRADLREQIAALLPTVSAQFARMQGLARARKLENNAYVRLGLTVAERYIGRVQSNGTEVKQTDEWSWLQIAEVRQVLDDAEKLIETPLALQFDGVTGPINTRDGVFTQPKNGVETPVFLGGYGHFSQVAKDLPGFNDYGVSIVQQERGPNNLLPDGTDKGGATDILNVLKTAERNHVKVDLLLSPHYFPQWAIDQAPDVINDNDGFIKFNIDHPKAREVIEKWLRLVVPQIKDSPALFSVTLSNEPVYFKSGRDEYSRLLYTEFLRQKHGNIAALNALYGTSYARFEDAAPPASNVPAGASSDGEKRAFYDWALFNQRHFADWHRWMNGLVKELAPNLKTQVKIMSFYTLDRGQLNHGIDLEMLSEITDLAGNDNYAFPLNATNESASVGAMKYAYNWQTEQMSYDLQRSFANQPIFNGENHLIPDRYTAPVPMEHTRSVLWQGALHGMGGTTTWLWEESPDPNGDAAGSIYFRPANAFAAGRAWLDLARLNREAAAVVRAKPRVAILYSQPSLMWSPEYPDAMRAAYSALTFLGEPVGFVTAKQLQENRAPFSAIILPRATHATDATVAGIARHVAGGGQLIRFGDGNLEHDEYGRPRALPQNLRGASLPYTDSDLIMWQRMQPILALLKPHALLQATIGQQTFGVEYRFVQDGARRLLSLNNLQQATQIVRIPGLQRGAQVRDLLSGETLDASRIALLSMQPRMIFLNP